MNRGNKLMENVAKLNTFVEMSKSNEYLQNYIEKIMNGKSKKIKFIEDFNFTSLDLLYTSLQIMHKRGKITNKEIEKLDKKELAFYFNKKKGVKYFKEQVSDLKTEENIINYLITSLSDGKYTCKMNNTIRFENHLVVDAEWLMDFSSFLITSLNINQELSSDRKTYSFKTVEIPESKKDKKIFLKNIKLYEYNVTKKNSKELSFQEVKYLVDILSSINEYDFKKLQEINSILAKEKFALSINKTTATFRKDQRNIIEKYLTEDHLDNTVLEEYIKNSLNCYNTNSRNNKKELISTFELLKSLAHAYKCHMGIENAHKLFSLDIEKYKIKTAFTIAEFYINYIYDEENMHKYFNYELLHLEELKPTIDYDTTEYKNILNDLSVLNKKVINENRKINQLLMSGRKIAKKNKNLIQENNILLRNSCQELEHLVKEVKAKQNDLETIKENNRNKTNMNKTKIHYIKESIMTGKYSYNKKENELIFDCYSEKDYHQTFHLSISLDDFISILLADYNRNLRIEFYQL